MKRNSNGKSGRELFAQAINKSIDMHVKNELNGTIANGKCSKNHKRIVKNILFGNGEKALPERKSLSRRTVAAILIAAILLLTGCAAVVIYHNEIAGFFETVFDNHTVVTPSDNDGYPTNIEEIYEFTYIPEGYELTEASERLTIVIYDFKNSNDNKLRIKQSPAKSNHLLLDNEIGKSELIVIGKLEIYYQSSDEWHKYIFEHNKYWFTLEISEKINTTELEKIYSGIKIK